MKAARVLRLLLTNRQMSNSNQFISPVAPSSSMQR